MSTNKRVLLLVCSSILLYFAASVIGSIANVQWEPFQRINLIGDLIPGYGNPVADTDGSGENKTSEDTAISTPPVHAGKNFDNYQLAGVFTDFNADTSYPAMSSFMEKLYQLKTTKKGKIRVAYLGDSMIEADLITQTIRKLLQEYFGGNGVGFISVNALAAQMRQTVNHSFSSNWTDASFKNNPEKADLYLSGHAYTGNNSTLKVTDKTITDSAALIEKSIITGRAPTPVNIIYNGAARTIQAEKSVNRNVLASDNGAYLAIEVNASQLPVYGISMESANGIFVDNFSFRGISGIEYGKISTDFLSAIHTANPYDLIVFQYGVNVMFRPNDKNFSWYKSQLTPVIHKFKEAFSGSTILINGVADRAFKYNGVYKSAIGIDSMIKTQAIMAEETGSSFYNVYATMGGENAMVQWATQKPALANKDYIHPNHKGAEELGKFFVTALLNDYRRYTMLKTKELQDQ